LAIVRRFPRIARCGDRNGVLKLYLDREDNWESAIFRTLRAPWRMRSVGGPALSRRVGST